MTAFDFAPTRSAGLARLDAFLPRAGRDYARLRNFDYGPLRRDNVSGLSPWLRHRLLTETEVLGAVLQRHSLAAAEKFVAEVFWRTYFKGWLEQRPSVWAAYLDDLAAAREQAGEDYAAAAAGRTGIDCFDAWADELVRTGYLHNHARMWFASIWIFTLRLPWQLGADFFLRHLLDGDPASNTLSWRWVAGLHTVGKIYLAQADNIARFTEGRFAPAGLVTEAVAVSEDRSHPRVALPESRSAGSDPCVLVLMTDDLTPPDGGDPVETLVLLEQPEADTLAARFRSAAAEDTAARLGGRCLVADATGASWFDGVLAAAERCGTRRVVLPYCPVGPLEARLSLLRETLSVAGLDVIVKRSAYDSEAWPYAKAGYFGLKKKIPAILRTLGLPAAG